MPEMFDRRGDAIVYDVYEPEGEPRGVIQVLHGVGEHAARYRAFGEDFAARGWIVYADDHRGHGRTGLRQHGGDLAKLGRLGKGGHRAAEDAIWQLTERIRATHPDLPLVLLGHSWGSFLAQILVNEHPDAYDAVVLIGTALRLPGSLNTGDLNAPWRTKGSTGVEWLCSDPVVQQEALDDPMMADKPLLVLFGPVNAARIIGRPRRGLAELAGHPLPMLLLVGREDTVGGVVSVHRLAEEYRDRGGLKDVTTHVYDGRHELLNEPHQAQVRADIASWLTDRLNLAGAGDTPA